MSSIEQIEEEEYWQREQENDAEFDYLDMQINRNEKIKQSVRDKGVLIKKKIQISTPPTQHIVTKKPKPVPSSVKIQKSQIKKEQSLQKPAEIELSNNTPTIIEKKPILNVDECDWEDLY